MPIESIFDTVHSGHLRVHIREAVSSCDAFDATEMNLESVSPKEGCWVLVVVNSKRDVVPLHWPSSR